MQGNAGLVLPLIIAFVGLAAVAGLGSLRPAIAGPLAVLAATLSFAATLGAWLSGGGRVDVAWAPTWDLALTFALDGLAALFALLATGVGIAVFSYSLRYVPLHLAHQGRDRGAEVRFYGFMLLFMASMIGLVMALDLLLLIIFWDLTAIASYFLIGYDRDRPESRRAALMALLVTGITSVFLIIGTVMLFAAYGTVSLPELIERAQAGPWLTVAGALMAVAGLAKSAQAPLHFWLPRAMVAPTPVSAYLHSAAMVAAGVFLLGRLYPLLQLSQPVLDGLLAVGVLSMVVGGTLALTRDVFKQVLAYSTISQYGYVVTMFGLGGEHGAAGAAYYVLAHGLMKSALFLTAGAVTEATGEDRLSRTGGVARSLPALAAGSGMAAAGLAALPLTMGFFKDELFFQAALERGWPFTLLALGGAVLTFAYIWRFWSGIFLGSPSSAVGSIPGLLTWPVVALGFIVLAAGIVVEPVARLAGAAGESILGRPAPVSLAYHLDARPANLLALATYLLGIVVIWIRPIWAGLATGAARLGARLGPERWYTVTLKLLRAFSRRLLYFEVRDLRGRIASILVPAAVVLAAALVTSQVPLPFTVRRIQPEEWPLVLFLVLAAVAAVVATRPRRHLTLVLALSSVGYSLAGIYVFHGAPDVALVAVLIETVLTLLLLGMLSLLPGDILARESRREYRGEIRYRNWLVGGISWAFAFVITWGVLSRPAPEPSIARQYIELTPVANAGDVVTAVLADFRGLDTLGEVTVITIALIGVMAVLTRWRAA